MKNKREISAQGFIPPSLIHGILTRNIDTLSLITSLWHFTGGNKNNVCIEIKSHLKKVSIFVTVIFTQILTMNRSTLVKTSS